jgi:hypothetical protein
VTDENGVARFATIYPGWYQGRAGPHPLHDPRQPRVRAGLRVHLQLYFDDALTDEVHSQGLYAEKGSRDQRNSTDGIYQGGGDELTLALTPSGEGLRGDVRHRARHHLRVNIGDTRAVTGTRRQYWPVLSPLARGSVTLASLR